MSFGGASDAHRLGTCGAHFNRMGSSSRVQGQGQSHDARWDATFPELLGVVKGHVTRFAGILVSYGICGLVVMFQELSSHGKQCTCLRVSMPLLIIYLVQAHLEYVVDTDLLAPLVHISYVS